MFAHVHNLNEGGQGGIVAPVVSRKEVVVTEEELSRLMEAMEYLKTGASYREAAKKFGFSTTYLWRRGKAFGLISRKLGVNY